MRGVTGLRSLSRRAAMLSVALVGWVGSLAGQEMAVPAKVHVPMLIKLLSFDRNLPSAIHGELAIGVLFQGGYRASRGVEKEVCSILAKLPDDVVDGYPVVVTPIDADTVKTLAAVLHDSGVSVLYVTPLHAFDFETLITAADAEHVRTMTGVPEYVKRGVAVAIDREAGRSEIVINVVASRAQGADFTAQLLKLARIVD